jgi:hypothetical protein
MKWDVTARISNMKTEFLGHPCAKSDSARFTLKMAMNSDRTCKEVKSILPSRGRRFIGGHSVSRNECAVRTERVFPRCVQRHQPAIDLDLTESCQSSGILNESLAGFRALRSGYSEKCRSFSRSMSRPVIRPVSRDDQADANLNISLRRSPTWPTPTLISCIN